MPSLFTGDIEKIALLCQWAFNHFEVLGVSDDIKCQSVWYSWQVSEQAKTLSAGKLSGNMHNIFFLFTWLYKYSINVINILFLPMLSVHVKPHYKKCEFACSPQNIVCTKWTEYFKCKSLSHLGECTGFENIYMPNIWGCCNYRVFR